MLNFKKNWLLYFSFFAAAAFSFMKLFFAYRWYFDGISFWSAAFRPFPSWGEGAELYGALLPAKWIGTRNLTYGIIIAIGIYLSYRFKKYRFLAFLLLDGAAIEFLDGFWLANGKYNAGWAGPNMKIYMVGGFLWVPVLLTCSLFLILREADAFAETLRLHMKRNALIYLSLLVAVGYSFIKFWLAFNYWFHGTEAWSAAFRPFPSWGEGAELYGALLPAKWIGTRNSTFGIMVLVTAILSGYFNRYKFLASWLFYGAAIEFLDGFLLTLGKLGYGWSGPETNSYIIRSVVLVVVLLASASYLMFKTDAPAQLAKEAG